MLGSASTFSEDCVSTSNCIVAPKSIKTAKIVSMLMVPSCTDRNSARSLFHFCRSDRAGSEFGTTMCTASCGFSAVTSTNIISTVGLFQRVPHSLARVQDGSREGGKLERPSRSSKSGVRKRQRSAPTANNPFPGPQAPSTLIETPLNIHSVILPQNCTKISQIKLYTLSLRETSANFSVSLPARYRHALNAPSQ